MLQFADVRFLREIEPTSAAAPVCLENLSEMNVEMSKKLLH